MPRLSSVCSSLGTDSSSFYFIKGLHSPNQNIHPFKIVSVRYIFVVAVVVVVVPTSALQY